MYGHGVRTPWPYTLQWTSTERALSALPLRRVHCDFRLLVEERQQPAAEDAPHSASPRRSDWLKIHRQRHDGSFDQADGPFIIRHCAPVFLNGTNGLDGLNGADGRDGLDGLPGEPGPPGASGEIDTEYAKMSVQVVGALEYTIQIKLLRIGRHVTLSIPAVQRPPSAAAIAYTSNALMPEIPTQFLPSLPHYFTIPGTLLGVNAFICMAVENGSGKLYFFGGPCQANFAMNTGEETKVSGWLTTSVQWLTA